MESALRSSVVLAFEKFAVHIRNLHSAASTLTSSDVERIHVKAEWLIRMLTWVRATMDDAEDMDPTDESVRHWLRELEGVADAAEDVLDHCLHEAMRLGLMGDAVDGVAQQTVDLQCIRHLLRKRLVAAVAAEDMLDEFPQDAVRLGLMGDGAEDDIDQVRSFYPTPPLPHKSPHFLCRVEQRIEEIVSIFMNIEKPEQALQREFDDEQIYVETMSAGRATISTAQEPCVFGRDEDLAKVKQFLLSSDGEEVGESSDMEISVMAIVGMGGLGKTTLAQVAFHDDEVSQRFQLKFWVCVSENFDIIRLTRAMVEPFDREACHISELDPLHQKLKKILDEEEFLLVLDDVWEIEKLSSHWNLLTAPLHNGSKGSKIIITTRNNKVSEIGGKISTYNLPCLNDEDCLKLFKQHAFEGRDPHLFPNLVAIGKKIANNCKGLPLAAKTIGGQLHVVDGEEAWNRILKSDAWNNTVQGESIMPILRLSYRHLPAHLKRCFRYCSIFPKDYEFDKDRLIRMWLAQGYIKVKRRVIMEDAGKRSFNDLLSRSFFQCSNDGQTFLMHDLMHDLAISVSGGECYGQMATDEPCMVGRHARHFSFTVTDNSIISSSLFSTIDTYEPQSVRSLIAHCKDMRLVDYSLVTMRHLKVLVLEYVWFTEFPESITHLKHLRYLSLNLGIMVLPESVGNLYHLQSLELTFRAENFTEFVHYNFPNWILTLVNLRHLICQNDGIDFGVRYPVGIGKLTELRRMPYFNVNKKCCRAKLGELREMNNIEGSLTITGISNLTTVDEAKKSCLEKKRKLRSLCLEWSLDAAPSRIDNDVLESLKPSPKLGNLIISGFKGTSLPSWLGHPSFSTLAMIDLVECQNWASLPPLGQLPSVTYLSILSANSVKSIGREFFSGGFPQLRTLKLVNMKNCKSCVGVEKGECPHLRELIIVNCVNLVSLSVANLDALETLRINSCDHVQFPSEEQLPSSLQVFMVSHSHSLSEWCQYHRQRLLHVQHLKIQGLDNRHLVLQNVRSVKEAKDFTLKLLHKVLFLELAWYSNPKLVSPGNCDPSKLVLENLQPCSNLNELVIHGYDGLMFASWLGDPSFSSLVSITLRGCSHCKLLPPLGQLPLLKKLHIKGAQVLRHIGKEFFHGSGRIHGKPGFPHLKKLELNDMPNWEEWVGMEKTDLPHLQELIIRHCPMLTKLPPSLPTLNALEIENCNAIIFQSSLNHLSSLRTLKISQMPTFHKLPSLPIGLTKLTLRCLPELANLVMPTSVLDFELQGCNEVLVASLPHLTHLTSLRISDFQNLTRLPLRNLAILQDLCVSNCPSLMTIDCIYFFPAFFEYIGGLQALKSLEHLSVYDCPVLHFSSNDMPPSTLQFVDIANCPLAESWRDRVWRKHAYRVDLS